MRQATLERKTNETDIRLTIELDGSGKSEINTGIGFFDHMLTAFARHSGFDLAVSVKGDLHVDSHHTIEDTGIVLGAAIAQAVGDKAGISRYGTFFVPMDESLGFCSVDVGGRFYLVFDCCFDYAQMGGFDTAMVKEFFQAVAVNALITLHLKVPYGENDHHKCEALFKAFGHAMSTAVCKTGDSCVLSTKGTL